MLYAQTDPDPGLSNYKYPYPLPPSHLFFVTATMSAYPLLDHSPACDSSCDNYEQHLRHLCCEVCHSVPSPPSTQEVCPTCHSPVDLLAAIENLSDAVDALTALVEKLSEQYADDGPSAVAQ